MDGIHDMGGRQGFGPIEFSDAEALGIYDPFPTPEGARAWAAAMGATNPDNGRVGGLFRFVRECMLPVDYLERPYAEQWLTVTTAMLAFGGTVSPAEIATGRAVSKWPGDPPMPGSAAGAAIRRRDIYDRQVDAAPAFSVGDTVTANPMGSTGHTRLPAYVQGRPGMIHAHHGAHILPDTGVHGLGEQPTHLYTVAFRAADLWPERAGCSDKVFLDLWECYLNNE